MLCAHATERQRRAAESGTGDMEPRDAAPPPEAGPGAGRYAALDAPALRALLTERDRALADLAAAQEEFLRAVSHDLRAPLRHITSYSPLVRELVEDSAQGLTGEPRSEAAHFLDTMDHAARRMGQMLDGLLGLSRVGRAALQPQAVDLARLVQDAQSQLAPQAAGRPVEWVVDTQGLALHADPVLLRQLLGELLGNALKFTARPRAAGGPAHIAVTARRGQDGWVDWQVRDDGAGFDPARAGALFGVFQRVHRESEFDGVGVGLATARAIALRHGASIAISAAPGAGCTVSLRWPQAGVDRAG